ncbi:MAG: oligopeptide/dipeptide ABC transporter ATP-binding protein [Protaetiibacter sp.]
MTVLDTQRSQVVFRAAGIVKRFGRRSRATAAVDGVDLTVYLGESLGIVGESGSGKTTLGRILMGFETATDGKALFHGESIAKLRGASRARFRRRVQMVFQNPYASLNPLRTIGSSLSDGYRGSGKTAAQRTEELHRLLDKVGLNESILERYPHEFSGGQRQRIVLARALTVEPEVLVADEPLSALDVSIQAQVLNLLNDLRQSLGLTVVMITHDLRVVNFFCDRIAVMYMGALVEIGSRDEIMNRSWHPYTRMLISAAPHDTPGAVHDRPWIRNDPDRSVDASAGCRFAARCWLREQLGNPEKCVTERPELRHVSARTLPAAGVHGAACHFADQVQTAAGAVER